MHVRLSILSSVVLKLFSYNSCAIYCYSAVSYTHLKEDIVNLGYKNDIVTVKSGYGRNYLIPTGKAVIASPAAKKMLAEEDVYKRQGYSLKILIYHESISDE